MYTYCTYVMLYVSAVIVHIVCIALCVLRGMVDENGEQFVAYFMPTQETIQKRDEDKKLEIPYRDGEE